MKITTIGRGTVGGGLARLWRTGGDDGTDRLYGVETLLFRDVTQAVTTVTPEVSSIATFGPGILNGTGSLGVGTIVTFTVNANKAVTITGAPTLALSDGATARYTGGSGTTTLTFRQPPAHLLPHNAIHDNASRIQIEGRLEDGRCRLDLAMVRAPGKNWRVEPVWARSRIETCS